MELHQESQAWATHLEGLVELEWEEEKQQVLERLTEWPEERLAAEGLMLGGLVSRLGGPTAEGRLQVSFVAASRGSLPPHEFQRGDQLIVSTGDPLASRLKAQVVGLDPFAVHCEMSEPPPRPEFGQLIRLDRGANTTVHQRTLVALQAFRSGRPQDEVRRILLEMDVDGNNAAEARPLHVADSLLNASQRAAVASLERRRISLIQGPPGCGKTYLACSILQAARRRAPVLAVADSNVAVDQLLGGLLKRGVRAVRFGSSASITDSDLLLLGVEAQASADMSFGETLSLLLEEVAELRRRLEELGPAPEEQPEEEEEEEEEPEAEPWPPRHGEGREPDDGALSDPRWADVLGQEVAAVADSRSLELLRLDALRLLQPAPQEEEEEDRGRILGALASAEKRLASAVRKCRKERQEAVRTLLDGAEVVCATIAGCGAKLLQDRTFEFILMDEASQVTEPRALIAISLLAPEGRLVLVGDHRQLPPVCVSKRAEAKGLGVSLFDRLLHYPSLAPALLTVQYRMHPILSKWPSDTFYGGRLVDGVTESQRTPVDGFDWPVAGGMAFVEAGGEEQVSPGGFSRHNLAEAALVRGVIDRLLLYVPAQDVGVISPYRGQVHLLAEVLGGAVEVRTVDSYQGREKEVIVFSCVRSNLEGKLGFLADPRRLNVALTRARRGLIVVGNAATLRRGDRIWRSWLQFVGEYGLAVPHSGAPKEVEPQEAVAAAMASVAELPIQEAAAVAPQEAELELEVAAAAAAVAAPRRLCPGSGREQRRRLRLAAAEGLRLPGSSAIPPLPAVLAW